MLGNFTHYVVLHYIGTLLHKLTLTLYKCNCTYQQKWVRSNTLEAKHKTEWLQILPHSRSNNVTQQLEEKTKMSFKINF